jgi:diguanylate cyclase (GGDEF)-like protein
MIEQEFWKKVAHTDALTKLGNRLRFEERKKEIKKSNHKLGLSVLMIDINDLKIINDKYGHKMGDTAIATVGHAILDIFAEYGECYRIGGDEFCLFLEMLNKEQAMEKAEECEFKLKEFSDEHKISLHIAKGFSEIKNIGIDAAINIADTNMYKNKEFNKIKRKKVEEVEDKSFYYGEVRWKNIVEKLLQKELWKGKFVGTRKKRLKLYKKELPMWNMKLRNISTHFRR